MGYPDQEARNKAIFEARFREKLTFDKLGERFNLHRSRVHKIYQREYMKQMNRARVFASVTLEALSHTPGVWMKHRTKPDLLFCKCRRCGFPGYLSLVSLRRTGPIFEGKCGTSGRIDTESDSE